MNPLQDLIEPKNDDVIEDDDAEIELGVPEFDESRVTRHDQTRRPTHLYNPGRTLLGNRFFTLTGSGGLVLY